MNVQKTLDPRDHDISSDVERLKSDLKTLSDDVRSLTNSAAYTARRKADEGVEKGKELWQEAEVQTAKTRDSVTTRIQEKPLTAVGIAMGAGLLLGALSRR